MDRLFLSWMTRIFLKHCGSQRLVLLFFDGHASHITLYVIDLAQENDVVLFCLPPHTTHALQPLNVSVFKSLKPYFSKAVKAVSFMKRDFIVSKRELARVVKQPFKKAFSISNIKAGFEKWGVYPYNPDAIDKTKITPSFSSSTDESDTPVPASSSSSSGDLSASIVSVPSSDESSLESVNPSPVVSSF